VFKHIETNTDQTRPERKFVMNTAAPPIDDLEAPRGIFATLLQASDEPNVRTIITQVAIGFGLAAVFGLALGMRDGGWALFQHGFYVPVGIAAVFLMGIPAYYVGMALIDAPINPRSLVSTGASAMVATGAVLAGLAPAAALYVVTSNGSETAGTIAVLSLVIAGVIGLRTLLRATSKQLREASAGKQVFGFLITGLFVVFATLFAARIWFSSLPILGGS
jgi:hypothetical protein